MICSMLLTAAGGSAAHAQIPEVRLRESRANLCAQLFAGPWGGLTCLLQERLICDHKRTHSKACGHRAITLLYCHFLLQGSSYISVKLRNQN